MTKLEQAARQLLEAVEDFQEYRQDIDTAIADLHEALEEARRPAAVEQEPVAGARCKVIETCKECQHCAGRQGCTLAQKDFNNRERPYVIPDWCPLPLYVESQSARQPLTGEQIDDVLVRVNYCALTPKGIQHAVARAIERAHGIGSET